MYELVTHLDVVEVKEAVVILAPVTESEVDRGAVGSGGLHHLGHNPGDVDLLLLRSLPSFFFVRVKRGSVFRLLSMGGTLFIFPLVSLAAVSGLCCVGVDAGHVRVVCPAVAVTLTLFRRDLHVTVSDFFLLRLKVLCYSMLAGVLLIYPLD